MSALLTLAEMGIHLRHPNRPGEHRAPCPWCDRGSRCDALAVKLDPDGSATWFCHRCQERGATGGGRSEWRPRPSPTRQDSRPEPERHDTLATWGQMLWAACRAIEPGTVAAAYLDRRGCNLPPEAGDLRWHPGIKHRSGHVGPALVGLLTDVLTGEAISLHRTWLAADGGGKADLDKPRLLLAKHRSDGVIRIWPDEDVTAGLVIGEGVETCLAAARAGRSPVWATISAGNMSAFPVLAGLEGLTVLVDHDLPNPKTGKRAGIEAARAVVLRYAAAGFDPERDLVVILPPTEGQDCADLVLRAAA